MGRTRGRYGCARLGRLSGKIRNRRADIRSRRCKETRCGADFSRRHQARGWEGFDFWWARPGGDGAWVDRCPRARTRLRSSIACPFRGFPLPTRYCSERGERITIERMCNWAAATAISVLIAANVLGQTAAPVKSTGASPSPTPRPEQLIDSLGQADLQAAIALLKSNFTHPDAITETELNRATLQGLLVRMPGGLMFLPNRESAPAESAAPFYSEIFEGHIGYIRLGALNGTNLKELDKKLQEFATKKIDALIVDLRDSATGDFAMAGEFGKRF